MLCEICKIEFENNKFLASHIRFQHKMATKDYYDKYLKSENEGICACPGCNNLTKYYKLHKGYAKYCSSKCQRADPLSKEKLNQTMLEKYGVTNNFIRPEIIRKAHTEKSEELRKQTNLKKYGVENVLQSQQVINKSKQTNLKKYGVEYGCMTSQCREKLRSPDIQIKKSQTMTEHFGVSNNLSRPEVQQKIKESHIQHFGKYYLATDENRKKCNSLDARQKAIITKKKNGTINSSSFEKDLAKFFEIHNINYISEYTDARYPFHCDFYLPDEDCFIELNIHWTHGGHWFNEDNDLNILNQWKEKAKKSKYYRLAIKIWTEVDPNKYNIAKENKLNYIVLWNLEDIEQFKSEVIYAKKK